MIKRNRNNLRLLVQAFVLTCLVFNFSAFPQDSVDKPMETKALAGLIEELKGVVDRTAPVKTEAKLVGEKWDKREDLDGKTQKEVIDLLYADVESVIKDSGTRYQIFSMFAFYKRVPFGLKDKPANGVAGEADKPMEAKALAALIKELKGVVDRTAPVKNEAKLVGEKWNKREDLAGKTRKQVIDLLYADVESVIKDSGTRYQIFSMFSFYKRIGTESTNRPNPVLLDDFQRSNCEDVLARFDSFVLELQNNPSAMGYVVTSGDSYPKRTAEREMRNAIRDKALDSGRFVFVDAGGSGDRASIAYWLVPPGADASKIPGPAESSGDVSLSPKTEPYIFGQTSADELGGCSNYDPEFYAETLKANPASRGNIVIYETSRRKFLEMEKEILSKLTGIARKRLRTFFVQVRPGDLREGVELWLLP